MIPSLSDPFAPEPDLRRVLEALQDALVELEVWRQSARAPEEWAALRRMAAALSIALQEVTESGALPRRTADAAQQSLLPGGDGMRG